jgi:hypothetical protein
MQGLKDLLFKSRLAQFAVVLFIVLTVWWLTLMPFSPTPETENARYIWGAFYQLTALWGGLCGLAVAKSWGGLKSVMGKSIFLFALGLLFQVFGQNFYSYYNLFLKIEVPYPSIGDIGFFGTLPLYVMGILLMAKASGIKLTLKSYVAQLQVVGIPLIMLVLAYAMFIRGNLPDWSEPVTAFLTYGYPLMGAIYSSLAILTFILSRRVLGGIMRKPIFFLLIALMSEYIADFVFPYMANNDLYYVASIGDYLYVIAYSLMSIALIRLGLVLRQANET